MTESAPVTPSAGAVDRRRSGLVLVALLLTGVLATLVIYQPWHRGPFDIVDFAEFLPLLHRPSIGSRWAGFIQYYASQGRWNILAYVSLILKWSLFGANTVDWQLLRFAEVWLVIIATYLVLRRLGADLWGAAAGAALFTVADPAVTVWLRLTMGEPLGLCFLLPAVYVAAGYRAAANWRRGGALMALCVALTLLTKEMLIAFVPFVLAVGCCVTGPGRLAPPRNDERTRWLLVSSAVAAVAVLLPVALVAHAAPRDSFASQYTMRALSPLRLLENVSIILLPAGRARPAVFLSRFIASANVLFLFIVATGAALLWQRGYTRGISRRQVMGWGALTLLLPISAVAAYAPWSVFQEFYAIPFLFSAAMLIAASITATNVLAPRWGVAVGAAYVAMIAILAIRAAPVRARYNARRDVNAAVVEYLADHAAGAPVLVVAHGFSGNHWPGTGPALGKYAAALYPDVRFTAFQDDTTCSLPPRTFESGGRAGVIVSYADDCGTYPNPSATFEARYHFLTLHPLTLQADSIRIDVCDTDCTRRPAAHAAQ